MQNTVETCANPEAHIPSVAVEAAEAADRALPADALPADAPQAALRRTFRAVWGARSTHVAGRCSKFVVKQGSFTGAREGVRPLGRLGRSFVRSPRRPGRAPLVASLRVG